MTEPKKRVDYSASAENLCNPQSVGYLLDELVKYQRNMAEVEDTIQALIPQDLKETKEILLDRIGVTNKAIREAIDRDGSYQDVECCCYGIKQRRVSLSYDAQAFEASFPQAAPLVITKAVNVKALEGLIKGRIVSTEDLAAKGVSKETVSYRYIIEVKHD